MSRTIEMVATLSLVMATHSLMAQPAETDVEAAPTDSEQAEELKEAAPKDKPEGLTQEKTEDALNPSPDELDEELEEELAEEPTEEGNIPTTGRPDTEGAAVDEVVTEEEQTDDSEPDEAQGETPEELFEFDAPIPFADRRPNLKQGQLGVDIHYGLVGSGPTRLINDVHFALTDWWTLRTSFTLLPTNLMNRIQIGEIDRGAYLLEAGIESYDGGSTNPDLENPVGWRLSLEGGVGYARKLNPTTQIYAMLHYRELLAENASDIQRAAGGDITLMFSINDLLGAAVGLSHVELLGTDFVQRTIDFVEIGRPGMSYYMVRDEGLARSTSIPMSLTYGLLRNFDVDVFITPRIYPKLDVVFGAGFKWRFGDDK